jgi:hypothetical protein
MASQQQRKPIAARWVMNEQLTRWLLASGVIGPHATSHDVAGLCDLLLDRIAT